MKTRMFKILGKLVSCLLLVTQAPGANLQDLLPLQKGYVVTSCFSGNSTSNYNHNPNGPVIAVVDGSATELAGAPLSIAGGAHPWRSFHNETALQNPNAPSAAQIWNAANLGEVFGITIDEATNPNIYVAATTTYGVHPYPAGNGPGTVYKLDGATGAITAFNSIPNAGPALGNLTSWTSTSGPEHLYVTSFDDGLIYQLDMSGVLVGTYDHGVSGRPAASLAALADDATQAFTPLDRRLWGIEAHEGRLYYGVWTGPGAEIWSVALDPNGTPLPATAQIDVPSASFPNNYPASDIGFSTAGQMYVAQRYHNGVPFGGPHAPYVLEFNLVAGSWNNPSPANTYRVGNYGTGANSAGGVAVECTGAVWASGDALEYDWTSGIYIYGLHRIPAGGNVADVPASQNSYLVDLDCDTTTVLKTFLGDVEIHDPCDDCFDISGVEVECPPVDGLPYTVTFTVTNRSTKTASYIWHTPCPGAELPAGAITGQPVPVGPQLLPVPLATGDSATVTVDLPASNTGGTFCWRITLLDESGGECCTDKICIDLPDCSCFVVLDKVIKCSLTADGSYKFTMDITIQNTGPFAWHHVNLLPPAVFTPATFDLTGSPVPPGGTYTISTCVTGQSGDALCFNISVHDEDIEVCCAKECCIVLPPCGDAKPDECAVTRVAPCCPNPAGIPGGAANVTLLICNNSAVPRTYTWNIAAQAPSAECTGTLPAGAFSPPSGSITVPANSCLPVSITVNCDSLEAGQSACYETCVIQKDDPANRFCCEGRVYRPQQGEVIIKDGDPAGGGFHDPYLLSPNPDAPIQVNLAVINPADQDLAVRFEVRGLAGLVQIDSPDATNPGAGEVKRFEVIVPARSTRDVPLRIFADPGLSFANVPVPVFIYPLGAKGENQSTVSSFLTLAAHSGPLPLIRRFESNGTGEFFLTLHTTAGRVYAVHSSRTLGVLEPWGPIACTLLPDEIKAEEFTATGSTLVLRIQPGPDCPTMFYRAIETP